MADCIARDGDGKLRYAPDGCFLLRRDSLNLAGLGLTDGELNSMFMFSEGVPVSFSQLAGLRYLDLTGNQLTALPTGIEAFKSVIWLGLNFNRLENVAGVEQLVALERLYLRGNPLTKLPDRMGSLRELTELDLTDCKLDGFPSSMGHLEKLEHLAVDTQRLLPELKAAWKEQGWNSLRPYLLEGDRKALKEFIRSNDYISYLESLKRTSPDVAQAVSKATSLFELKGLIQMYELNERLRPRSSKDQAAFEQKLVEATQLRPQYLAKVVLVGAQEHGKTCLQRALRDEPFVSGHKSTDGMSREVMHLDLSGALVAPEQRPEKIAGEVIDVTLWDMGGQESYQHAHQMFFTPSAVYLAVTRPRHGDEKRSSVEHLNHWIELVRKRTGGEATIIVVSTWCSEAEPDAALTLTALQEKYGEMVRAFVAVDSFDGTGIDNLRKLLSTVIQEPRTKCQHRWQPGWAETFNTLGSAPDAFLRWDAIAKICADHGIADPVGQRTLIRTGHYIGSLLWREDIPAGEDVVILNPDWLSRAVARLLDDDDTQKAHGLVNIDQLERVWAGPGRDKTPGYKPDTYPALIELMEINEIAYRPREKGKKIGEGKLLLVTQMVADMRPQDIEAEWESIQVGGGMETQRFLAFRETSGIGYGEVPDLIYLLIFRLRDFSLGRADYRKAVHWKRGLLVMDDYGSVGRIELVERQLHITVCHRLGDGLMHSIIHRIGVRDDGCWQGLEKVEFVPCGEVCPKRTPNAGRISMADCATADRVGNKAVKCESCQDWVVIKDLLSVRPVEPPDIREIIQWMRRMEELIQSGTSSVLAEVRSQGESTRDNLGKLIEMHSDGIIEAFFSRAKEGPRLFSIVPIEAEGWSLKKWTHVEMRVTLWCEVSRMPVPFYGEGKGSEVVTFSREWVQRARKVLSFSSMATLALATGGMGAIGGLVAGATGAVIPSDDIEELNAELTKQQKAFKELNAAIKDDEKHPLRGEKPVHGETWEAEFSSIARAGFGTPVEDDLKLIIHLREEFKKKDPSWGGLKDRKDGKFGRVWAHPECDKHFG